MTMTPINARLLGRRPLAGVALAWALPRLAVYVIAALAGAALVGVWAAPYTFVWPGTAGQIEIPPLQRLQHPKVRQV